MLESGSNNQTYKEAIQMTKYNLPVTKEEVASELGVTLGADRTSRENGSVGGQMVKKIFNQFGPKR